MTIPTKTPCPCGYTGLDGKGKCNNFLVPPIINTQANSVSEDQADAIIETYQDAARLRWLLNNPTQIGVLQFKMFSKRRDWIDEQMKKPRQRRI